MKVVFIATTSEHLVSFYRAKLPRTTYTNFTGTLKLILLIKVVLFDLCYNIEIAGINSVVAETFINIYMMELRFKKSM